jgi:hypothetical protein
LFNLTDSPHMGQVLQLQEIHKYPQLLIG